MDGWRGRRDFAGGGAEAQAMDNPVEDWVEPFRRALAHHGHAAERHKWHIIWARKLAGWAVRRGLALERLLPEDVERFLANLATSPSLTAWQVDQAADSIRILFGSVFGQDWGRRIRTPDPVPPPDVLPPAGDDPVARLRYVIRCRRYSTRTEKSYADWATRYFEFCRESGAEAGDESVREFLERLVLVDNVAGATQAQALNALVFLFRTVIKEPLGDLGDFRKSKRPRKLPVVLSRGEVRR
jgi:hypothetical protein